MTVEAQEGPAPIEPTSADASDAGPRWRRRTEQALLAGVTILALAVIGFYALRDSSATIDLAAIHRGGANSPGWRPIAAPANDSERGTPAANPATEAEPRARANAPLLSDRRDAGRPALATDDPTSAATIRVQANRVPTDGESTPNPARDASGSPGEKALRPGPAQFQLDMNTAERAEWMQLPGIGEVLATRILESRERDGPFTRREDLRRVRGIGEKTLARLKPFLRPTAQESQ